MGFLILFIILSAKKNIIKKRGIKLYTKNYIFYNKSRNSQISFKNIQKYDFYDFFYLFPRKENP